MLAKSAARHICCPGGTSRKRLIAGQPDERTAGSAQVEAEASRRTRLLSRGQRGVRDPMDPAGDRRFGTPRSGESPAAGSIGSRGRGVGDAEEPKRDGAERDRDRRGPRRGLGEQRPRVITSSVGAELSPPTHGAHRVPIGWDSLPRKRTSFSPRLLFRFSSPADLSRRSLVSLVSLSLCLSVSHSLFPSRSSQSRVAFPATTRYSSLSSSRRSLGFHLCSSRESPFDTFRPCVSSVLFLFFTFPLVPLLERVLAGCPPSFGS